MILRKSASLRSLDNITVVILGLKNLKTGLKAMSSGNESLQELREKKIVEKNLPNHINEIDFVDPEEYMGKEGKSK